MGKANGLKAKGEGLPGRAYNQKRKTFSVKSSDIDYEGVYLKECTKGKKGFITEKSLMMGRYRPCDGGATGGQALRPDCREKND